ncbi:MAG: 1,4-alpha-glucan branching protein GlgB [Candidatus Rokubacteria bacterium]|nr:1,4-alpha-glucan branching protein GlgB [Candidatus Rokubacteria bacterium]
MRPVDLDALARGTHQDPFSLLGPHVVDSELIIRAVLPWAASARVAVEGATPPREMTRRHPGGVFEARVPDVHERAPYVIEATDSGGRTVTIDDPYRFPPALTDYDLYLLGEGTHYNADTRLGAHRRKLEGVVGVAFAVWAPNAQRVSVVGDFNGWDGRIHVMRRHPGSGVWEIFLPGVEDHARYKYEVLSHAGLTLKADPYAFAFEPERPRTASVVCDIDTHAWDDADWMRERGRRAALDAPVAIYEVHLGSWRRVPEDGDRPLTYRELAAQLPAYVADMGYTHVELLPVMEHPFYGSWGYQPLGYFAPTRRYGTPEDFMALIDALHRRGIGVILDWVPAHFPRDTHGLALFDGTHLYEHADPRQREHPDWGTLIFNYGRHEVANFLITNALFWLRRYHADGLRVDAVASMLYLDYSRKAGEWLPNAHGGRENLEAIEFLKRFNTTVYAERPDTLTAAEESTSWPMVSRPTHLGGLGFGFKWNMGWMHDVLSYFSRDPVHRRFHQNELTFGLMYAWTENFVLPLSHDEVVHLKRSMHGKMPGDDWQKFANLRALYAFMYGHPGKKLLFMGGEFGQTREWNHDASLDWHLLGEGPYHAGLQRLVRDLNRVYRSEGSLHQRDVEPAGFQWVDLTDADHSTMAFLRRGHDPDDVTVIVCNFTPVPRHRYRVGVPRGGYWRELINTDAHEYGGSGVGNYGGVHADALAWHGRPASLVLELPPLGVLYFTPAAG